MHPTHAAIEVRLPMPAPVPQGPPAKFRRPAAQERPMFENMRPDLRAHKGHWMAQGFWALVVCAEA